MKDKVNGNLLFIKSKEVFSFILPFVSRLTKRQGEIVSPVETQLHEVQDLKPVIFLQYLNESCSYDLFFIYHSQDFCYCLLITHIPSIILLEDLKDVI